MLFLKIPKIIGKHEDLILDHVKRLYLEGVLYLNRDKLSPKQWRRVVFTIATSVHLTAQTE